MEQAPSRGHEASPQSGLGVGCKLCSSRKKLRGLGVRAQVRRISIADGLRIKNCTPGSPLDQVDPPPSNRNLYRHPPRSGQGGVGLGQVGGCGSRGHLGFFKFPPPAPPIAKSNRGYFDVGASSQGRSTPISPGFRPSQLPPGRDL